MRIIIVGAGVSGLATANRLLALDPSLDVLVLESSERVGGKVWTDRTPEGFLCEGGVNGFLDNKPKTLELAAAVGIKPTVSFDASRKRFIYSEGTLHILPESPPAFFKSSLLSLAGRLRIPFEMIIPRGKADDETLAEFATRRLGREAYEKLIDPMASGVYAGDADNLSLKSCFSRIYEIERQYGSLIRGLISLQKKARRERKKDMPSASPGGKLTSFYDGMATMTDALAAGLGERLRLLAPVAAVSRSGSRYAVHLAGGGVEEADRVVLASPAYAQAAMLREIAPDVSAVLDRIPYPPLTVCCLGYRAKDVDCNLDGFGFLVPSREKRKILGTLWDTSIFPNRAPDGRVLLRSMIGGARRPDLASMPDDVMIDAMRSELSEIMGLKADPVFARTYRHEKAIPQYNIGHAAGLAAIDAALANQPGLVLSGNAYRGVSLNDCIENAYKVAEAIIKRK